MFYVPYNSTTKCAPKSCHFSKCFAINLLLQTDVDTDYIPELGSKPSRKKLDRMTHSRLCFPPEWDSPPPRAVSQETCWYRREVKRQLNVLVSLDKFSGTVVVRGVKYKERLVTSSSTGKGQNSISLYTSCSLLVHLACTLGLSNSSSAGTWSVGDVGLLN